PVRQAEGRPLAVRQDVKELSRICDAWLRKAVAGSWTAWEDGVEAGDGKLHPKDDGGLRIGLPLYAEFPDVERVVRRAIRGVIVLRRGDRNWIVLFGLACAVKVSWKQAFADQWE